MSALDVIAADMIDHDDFGNADVPVTQPSRRRPRPVDTDDDDDISTHPQTRRRVDPSSVNPVNVHVGDRHANEEQYNPSVAFIRDGIECARRVTRDRARSERGRVPPLQPGIASATESASQLPPDAVVNIDLAHRPVEVVMRDPGVGNDIDPAVVLENVTRLFAKWFPNGFQRGAGNPISEMMDVMRIYGLEPHEFVNIVPTDIDVTYRQLYEECVAVFKMVEAAHLLSNADVDTRVRRILDRLKISRDMLLCMQINSVTCTPGGAPTSSASPNDQYALWRFTPPNMPGELTAFQTLVIALLGRASKAGYTRHRDHMMAPILTVTGRATGAWRKVMSFKEFVISVTEDKLTNEGMWYYLTKSPGNFKATVDYLKISRDPEVPWLKPDRTVFAFRNGLFDAYAERFVPYEQSSEIFPLGMPTACKFFDVDLNINDLGVADYMDIHTPAFDQLMEPQNLSVELKRWALALFIGRMLYDVGDLDDWQIHPFVKGMSNTGKTKLLETIAALYEDEDVGVISNNIEPQFGLNIIAQKFIAIADDVRTTIKLDQSDFQNMASGTRVSCPVKHSDPLVVPRWTCSTVWSGNEVPDFHDNAGSYSRRLGVLLFANVVPHPDGTLGERLLEELPQLIVKGNWAYRNMLRRYGRRRGVWNILPTEFKEQRNEIAQTSNSLAAYLASNKICHGSELYMPLADMGTELKKYERDNGFPSHRWVADFYRGPLANRGLMIRHCVNKQYPRIQVNHEGAPLPNPATRTETFVIGCDRL
jgi:hypothetical protein